MSLIIRLLTVRKVADPFCICDNCEICKTVISFQLEFALGYVSEGREHKYKLFWQFPNCCPVIIDFNAVYLSLLPTMLC
jgi:hypothetical protein